MDWVELGKNIKISRQKKGYTQAQVAELTGYSVQHLSHVENGSTKMSVEFIYNLAEILKVSLDDLFGRSLIRDSKNEEFIKILKGCSLEEKEFLCNTSRILKEEYFQHLKKS